MPFLSSAQSWLRRSATLLLLALVVLLAACSHRAQPGQRVPNFEVVTAQGQHVDRDSFHGRILVLNFWATWCPPCVAEVNSLNRLQQQFPRSSVEILGISVDQDGTAYRNFLRQYHIDFLTARDPKAAIPHRYGTVKYPETYIIGPNGVLARKVVGEMNWDAPSMVRYLRDLTHGD